MWDQRGRREKDPCHLLRGAAMADRALPRHSTVRDEGEHESISQIPASAAAGGPNPLLRTLVQFVGLSMLGAFLFVFHRISLHFTPRSQAIFNRSLKDADAPRGQERTRAVLFPE